MLFQYLDFKIRAIPHASVPVFKIVNIVSSIPYLLCCNSFFIPLLSAVILLFRFSSWLDRPYQMDEYKDLAIDITFNNWLGVRNSALLCAYAESDPRVRFLGKGISRCLIVLSSKVF